MTLQSLENDATAEAAVESASTTAAAADGSSSATAAVGKTKQQQLKQQEQEQDKNNNASTANKTKKNNDETAVTTTCTTASFVRDGVHREICRQVVRGKLAKRRHLVVPGAIQAAYLNETIFPALLEQFAPQHVVYNGGVAGVRDWKISCYLEVAEGGVPTTEPHRGLLQVFAPLLEQCSALFLHWYRQQHACNDARSKQLLGPRNTATKQQVTGCRRLMTFVTRYTPAPGEQALLKHVDGAGKVDGSCVVALPVQAGQEFEGGGLTFWDGRRRDEHGSLRPDEIHYDTRAGDLAFIDRWVFGALRFGVLVL